MSVRIELSPDEAKQIISLLLVAELEDRDRPEDWTLAERLARGFGFPVPTPDDLHQDFYWPTDA